MAAADEASLSMAGGDGDVFSDLGAGSDIVGRTVAPEEEVVVVEVEVEVAVDKASFLDEEDELADLE